MRLTLSFKLTVALGLGMAGVFGAVSYWGHRLYRQTLDETNTVAAERMGDVIKRATRHSMMRNAREEVYFTIRTVGAQPGMKRIRIYNPEGQISFSTDEKEAGQFVDKSAEACYRCHAQSAPLVRLARLDRVRFFEEASGQRVLGLINAIENEPDCSNAACHAHPPEQRVLGVLDVQLSMAAADASVAAYARRELLMDSLGIVLLLGLCGLLVYFLVHISVRALMEGTRRFGAGDLAYRIRVRSNDEIGELAASFNRMGTDLQTAREEVAQWTQTLEERVKEKTEQVQHAVERMAEMQRLASLGKLSAAVAHEINNPLAGVLTYAKLLTRSLKREQEKRGDSPADEERREWLQIIEGETLRCGSLVKNLLTFARQVPMQVKQTNVHSILERCLRLIQHQLTLQNIEWEFQCPGDLLAECDASRIQQALLAIIVNAIEVMPHGGHLRLAARGEPELQQPERVVIEIADNGPGIPPEVLPHIFEPFFTTKEEGKSIGMGLSVSFGIVQQHGGEIRVESQVGRGTCFHLSLPLKNGSGGGSAPGAESGAAGEPAAPHPVLSTSHS